MMLRFLRSRRAGFTLIEIMIVIAIIAILAGIVVPNIMMARFEAGLAACLKNCETGMKAIQMARVRCSSWSQLADVLGGTGTSSVSIYGAIGSKMMEAGYLSTELRCKNAKGGKYRVVILRDDGAQSWFYRDWKYAQQVLFSGGICVVHCRGGHSYGTDMCDPCYEESLGAGFLNRRDTTSP